MSNIETADVLLSETINQSRYLPLSGAKNLRDLGGYTTADSRKVRSGVL